MKSKLLIIILCILSSKLIYGQTTITQDIYTFSQPDTTRKGFVRFGFCVGLPLLKEPQYPYEKALNGYIPNVLCPNFDVGITLNKRIKLDMEIDYQIENYAFNGYTENDQLNLHTKSLFLIPDVFISANKHKFTPYGRIGVIVSVLSGVTYDDQIYGNSSFFNYPVSGGILLSSGCELKIHKCFSIFGEISLKYIVNTANIYQYVYQTEPSLGINLGIKF